MTAVAFLAYIIKTATGFGTAIIVVSLGSMLVGTHEAVIISAIVDIIGGSILYFRDPVKEGRSFWMPLSAAMIAGTIVGAAGLKVFPAESFDILIGIITAVLGFWFILGRGQDGENSLETTLPEKCSAADLAVSSFAGLCGGLFAVSGPPIVFWLGRRFAKFAFRRTLIAVFFFATVVRLTSYGVVGLLHPQLFLVTLYVIPGIIFGFLLGNRIFHILSEKWFSRVVGGVLLVVAVKLLLQ